jgi:hypothetical protein
MKPKVSIVALVDVVGALSDATLHNGNLSLVDDGSFDSPGQGTPDLCTLVAAGQVIQWTALAVDVQTPVEIQGITFLGAGDPGPGYPPGLAAPGQGSENLDLKVWAGIVPACLTPGVTYRYRLELRMHDGAHSVLSVDSPALMCA